MKISSTSSQVVLSSESTTSGRFSVSKPVRIRRKERANSSIENAVYGYIQAIRALGRTKINTAEVAAALSLAVSEVNGALSALKKKGVRLVNG
jgi:hypothetical protein